MDKRTIEEKAQALADLHEWQPGLTNFFVQAVSQRHANIKITCQSIRCDLNRGRIYYGILASRHYLKHQSEEIDEGKIVADLIGLEKDAKAVGQNPISPPKPPKPPIPIPVTVKKPDAARVSGEGTKPVGVRTGKGHPEHCCYDWRKGKQWRILECVAGNPSHAKSATIYRLPSSDEDVLDELKESDMLTGQALLDAGEW
jgi:hypothetical protein